MMSKKVLVFQTENGEFDVMNVPEDYRRSSLRPRQTDPSAYPRFFADQEVALAEAHARHGHLALVIDETH